MMLPMSTLSLLALLAAILSTLFSVPVCSATATETADVIIIGAGTAGCALAARLCRLRPALHIRLLDRSGPLSPEQAFLSRSPRQMWNAWRPESPVAETFATKRSAATGFRPHTAITGRVLGGTSAINGRQWFVPLRGSVERWGIANLTTDTARTYYVRAFQTVGFDRQRVGLRHRYAPHFIAAAERVGYPINGDPFSSDSRRSMFENRISVDPRGINVNSCDAYMKPVLSSVGCPNLRLQQGVTVSKILLQGDGMETRAVGVEYIRTGDGNASNGTKLRRHKLHAKLEVISSAGPFNSPKLLQLSGIGRPSVLNRVGVNTSVDLPVGSRTQSRNFVEVLAQYTSALEPSNNSTLLNSPESRLQWESGRGGVLGTHSFFANGRDEERAYFTGTGSFFPERVDKKWIAANCNGNVDSFGSLNITSDNIFDPPAVDFGLLYNARDVHRLVRCLRTLVKIMRNMPLSSGVTLLKPNDGKIDEKYVRENAGWSGHFVGGCPVGSVLDARLRVKGVKNLRVVDSSSLSNIPTSAGPMASVYMLAEYCAELLAKDI